MVLTANGFSIDEGLDREIKRSINRHLRASLDAPGGWWRDKKEERVDPLMALKSILEKADRVKDVLAKAEDLAKRVEADLSKYEDEYKALEAEMKDIF